MNAHYFTTDISSLGGSTVYRCHYTDIRHSWFGDKLYILGTFTSTKEVGFSDRIYSDSLRYFKNRRFLVFIRIIQVEKLLSFFYVTICLN